MTLYCQSCGTELVEIERTGAERAEEAWRCLGCGDLYLRPEGYSDDQVVAWLGFKPLTPAA